MVRRWQQLPLDHALRASEGVRALAQALADETTETRHERTERCDQRTETRHERTETRHERTETRHERTEKCDQRTETGDEPGCRAPRIPDLGPATALDQLRVTVYDAQQAGLDRDLPERLTRLLHDIG